MNILNTNEIAPLFTHSWEFELGFLYAKLLSNSRMKLEYNEEISKVDFYEYSQ